MSKWSFPTKRKKEREERFILALDGGGMRGIVPSEIIARTAALLKEDGDDIPFYAHFDLIAGTSTGGLIALGLSSDKADLKQDEGTQVPVTRRERKGFFRYEDIVEGYIPRSASPEDFTDIYLNHGREIFSNGNRFFGSVFKDKYDTSGLEKFLFNTFHERRLEEALVPTMVVSYNTIGGRTLVLSSYNEYRDMLYTDAARATSAAPLYFPPKYIKGEDGRRMALIDGGVSANNPALLAYSEAVKLYPEAEHFHILSISTASPVYKYDPSYSSGGVQGWAEPMTHIYPNSQSNITDMTLTAIPSVSYYRIDGTISEEKIKMDDTRSESMAVLKAGADRIFKDAEDRIKELVDMLKRRDRWDNVRLAASPMLLTDSSSEQAL